MISRTQSSLARLTAGPKGVHHGASARTTPPTGHRPRPGRRPSRGQRPGSGLLAKLALPMAGALPGHGSRLERSAAQTPQHHPDHNAPTPRTRRRGPAPDAGLAWPRLWCRGHPAGARTARERACACTANDLSDAPPLCQGGALHQPPSYSRPSAGQCSPGIDMTLSSRAEGNVRRCVMDRTARLLLTREAVLSRANSLDLSREHPWRIRCLDVRCPW